MRNWTELFFGEVISQKSNDFKHNFAHFYERPYVV